MIDAMDYPNRIIGTRRLAPADAIDRQVVAVNFAESPLAWLARRGMLTGRQTTAGETLRRDYHRAGLEARVTMRWEPTLSGGAAGWRDGAANQAAGAIDAKRRFASAMEAVGRGLSDVVWRVVCEGEGLTQAEKTLGWPTRAAKLVLGMALDRLADHYDNRNGFLSLDNRDDIG